MASGGRSLSTSVQHGSDEVVELPCSICLKDGKMVGACKFCVDCQGNLCSTCVSWHNKFPGTSAHKTVDVGDSSGSQSVGLAPRLPTERCQDHDGKILDTFCPDHGAVCCASCVNINHRLCEGVDYIPKFAKGILDGQGKQTAMDQVEAQLKDLWQANHDKRQCVRSLYMDENDAIERMQDYRNRIVQRFNEQAESETDKIKEKYKEERSILYAEIERLNDQKKSLEEGKEKLCDFTGDNDSQLFVIVKHADKHTEKGRTLLEEMKETDGRSKPQFELSSDIESKLAAVVTLGSFVTPAVVAAAPLITKYNLKSSGDNSPYDIQGSCFLEDGTVLLTDSKHDKIVRLNLSTRAVNCTEVAGGPFSVCVIGKNQVATTLLDHKKVQMLNVGAHIIKTMSFLVNQNCRGICYDQQQLFVSCGSLQNASSGHVRVFDITGNLLRVIEKDLSGQRIFSVPIHLAVGSRGTILVADKDKGVITMDATGQVISFFSDPVLSFSYGVCALETGDGFLVSGYASNTILKVTNNVQTKILTKNITWGPQSLLLNPIDKTVIATSFESPTVRVYGLQ